MATFPRRRSDVPDGLADYRIQNTVPIERPRLVPRFEQLDPRGYPRRRRPLVAKSALATRFIASLGGKSRKIRGGLVCRPTEIPIDGETLALERCIRNQVTELPASAKVVGASDFCANARLALMMIKIWTIQPPRVYARISSTG